MQDNTIENVVQTIFVECDKEKLNKVHVNAVIKFISNFLQSNKNELLELENVLKISMDDIGYISRSLFVEAMKLWTDKYRDCTEQLEDSFEGILPGRKSDSNEKSFVHSTPRTSLGVLNHDYPLINEPFNISSASCPDPLLNKTILEDRIKELEYANWRITETMKKQKAQEQFSEDQIDYIKRELDLMTNKYILVQKLLDNFNKSEASKEEGTDNETDYENSQIDLDYKYKTLQKDYKISSVEFKHQMDELEQEKLAIEEKNIGLENKISDMNNRIKIMEADIEQKNNNIEVYKNEQEKLVSTNDELNNNLKEMSTIMESLRSQQKTIEGKLRKSLCYNDQIQTSFNALKVMKGIADYSKSKQQGNVSKVMEIQNKPIQNIIRATPEVRFSPPFKSTKFNFYNINSPKIRKSPPKESNISIKDIQIDQEEIKIETPKSILNTSSPPVMYVMYATPEEKLVNSSYDYTEFSSEEDGKFCHVDPQSPHMSLHTEIQEALSCSCEDTKQLYQKQIYTLNEEVKKQTVQREKLGIEMSEQSKVVQLLEIDKLRGVSSIRTLELEVESLKQKLKAKDCNFSNDFSNIVNTNNPRKPGREKVTFDKLQIKLDKCRDLVELKQEEIDSIKLSNEVYKARLVRNENLINTLYKNNIRIATRIKTMCEVLQVEVKNFMATYQEDIANSPRIVELLQDVVEKDENDTNDLAAEVLDFSNRISCVTEILRILANFKLEFKEMVATFQRNSIGLPAVDTHPLRFNCDSPDSPSVNSQHCYNQENEFNCTALRETDTNDNSKALEDVNKDNGEVNKGEAIKTVDFAMQTNLDGSNRMTQRILFSICILFVFYFLYESCNVHYRINRTM